MQTVVPIDEAIKARVRTPQGELRDSLEGTLTAGTASKVDPGNGR